MATAREMAIGTARVMAMGVASASLWAMRWDSAEAMAPVWDRHSSFADRWGLTVESHQNYYRSLVCCHANRRAFVHNSDPHGQGVERGAFLLGMLILDSRQPDP